MGFWITLISWSLIGTACAEYRLYQYMIRPYQTETIGLPTHSYNVISTLDPVSYHSYHGGRNIQEISLLRSWMCMGHTAGKESCPAPLDQVPVNPPLEVSPTNPPIAPLPDPS